MKGGQTVVVVDMLNAVDDMVVVVTIVPVDDDVAHESWHSSSSSLTNLVRFVVDLVVELMTLLLS